MVEEVWRKSIGHKIIESCKVALSPDESCIYMTGLVEEPAGEPIVLIKYDSDGNELWTHSFTPDIGIKYYPIDIATDSEGSIYISIVADDIENDEGVNESFPYLVHKYNDNGTSATEVWTKKGLSDYYAQGLAISSDGSVYISGYQDVVYDDGFLTKYNGDGDLIWTQRLGTEGNNFKGIKMRTLSDGRIYIMGETNEDEKTVAFVTKYIDNGSTATEKWTQFLSNPEENDSLEPTGIAAASDGSIYVSGMTGGNLDGQTNQGSWDIYVTKYIDNDNTASKEWTKLFGTSEYDTTSSPTISTDGSIYIRQIIITFTDDDGVRFESFLNKVTNDGTKVWTQPIEILPNNLIISLVASSDGSIYILGFNTVDDITDNAFLIKYTESDIYTPIDDGNIKTAVSLWLKDSNRAESIYGQISNWDTNNITNMSELFMNSSFNEDISRWDTQNVISMSYMFYGASLFNQNIKDWNTSKVTDMSFMFDGASSFNQSINSWSLVSLTSANSMFKDATSINQQFLNFKDAGVRFFGSNGKIEAYSGNSNISVNNMFSGARSQSIDGNFCFLAGTPVLTDQGLIEIEKITSGNSIGGVLVREVVSFENKDSFMVLFKKNSIGRDIPSQDTLVSQNHRVYLGKHLLRAKHLINNKTIVKEVMDTKTVYNVIMDQSKPHKMRVNNLLVETMDPKMKIKILPSDFNWQKYTKINSDLSHLTKSEAEKHYLRYGNKEKRLYKSKPKPDNKVPEDFNWKVYTFLHKDLKGLCEQEAIKHYLRHGKSENRVYTNA